VRATVFRSDLAVREIAPPAGLAPDALALAGDVRTAMRIQFELMPLHRHLFAEPNPIPLKWAMARIGLCGGTMRLPMTELSQSQRPVVEQALRDTGLLASD
jgi:4-hydroxy-tetrahydrodipicolinate synthase